MCRGSDFQRTRALGSETRTTRELASKGTLRLYQWLKYFGQGVPTVAMTQGWQTHLPVGQLQIFCLGSNSQSRNMKVIGRADNSWGRLAVAAQGSHSVFPCPEQASQLADTSPSEAVVQLERERPKTLTSQATSYTFILFVLEIPQKRLSKKSGCLAWSQNPSHSASTSQQLQLKYTGRTQHFCGSYLRSFVWRKRDWNP